MNNKHEIVPGVYWVGVKDWARRVFDALIPLPQGTSYNAYLVIGEKATALVDTVNPGFEEDLWQRIAAIIDPQKVDYVIMNHAEPDHAGALPWILARVPKAKVLLTEKGRDMAVRLYRLSEARMHVVHDGDKLNLDEKTLEFHEVPFVHWPETMFTFLKEDSVLFPCDFFGAHTARGFYAEGVPEIEKLAKSYFGEIMMPYRRAAQRALEKALELKPTVIAPSHGPIWRDPGPILARYQKWAQGETELKVLVVYVSMWGATERLVQAVMDELSSVGIAVVVHDLSQLDLEELAADLVDSRGLVFGAPTVLGGIHPVAAFALGLIRTLRPPLRFALLLSSHGWAGGGLHQAQEALANLDLEVLGTIDVLGQPEAEEIQRAQELARNLAQRIQS